MLQLPPDIPGSRIPCEIHAPTLWQSKFMQAHDVRKRRTYAQPLHKTILHNFSSGLGKANNRPEIKALAGPSSEKKVFPTYDPICVFVLLPACFLNTLDHLTVLNLR